jgi:hypothetical protein
MRQLLLVIEGGGWVSGADGVWRRIVAGTGAYWEEGEEHETKTETGLVALVLESDALDLLRLQALEGGAGGGADG